MILGLLKLVGKCGQEISFATLCFVHYECIWLNPRKLLAVRYLLDWIGIGAYHYISGIVMKVDNIKEKKKFRYSGQKDWRHTKIIKDVILILSFRINCVRENPLF